MKSLQENLLDDEDALLDNTGKKAIIKKLFTWGTVTGDFNCSGCNNLTSLEGSPKKVGGKDFDCSNCAEHFFEKDVQKYSNVKGKIYTQI